MNSKIIALIAIIPLLLLAVGGTSFANTSTNTQSTGYYSYGLNTTTSTITDLSYKGENGNLLLATELNVNDSGKLGLPLMTGMNFVGMKNATILNSSQNSVFLVMANHMDSAVNISLTAIPVPVRVDFNSQVGVMMDGMGFSSDTYGNMQSTAYSIVVNNTTFFIISNAQMKGSSSQVTFQSSGYTLVGIISFDRFVKAVSSYKYLNNDKFNYNATTGFVSGKYTNFTFSDGVFSSITYRMENTVLFSSLYATGNGSLMTGSSVLPSIPPNVPITLGSLFVYANNTFIIGIHDNKVLQTGMILDNGTLHLLLGNNISAKIIKTPGTDLSVSQQDSVDSAYMAANTDMQMNGNIQAGPQAVEITGNGITAYIFIQGAMANITGSHVNITTNGTARLTLVAPPGLQGRLSGALSAVEKALATGRIAAVISISDGSSTNASVTIAVNTTVHSVVANITNGRVIIDLSAEAGNHLGTNVAIFISNSVIATDSSLHLTFDGVSVGVQTANGVINATSNTTASYAVIKVSSGMLIIFHIPHFSYHTLVISGSAPSVTSGISQGDLYAILGVVAVIAVISLIAVAVRKSGKK